MAGVARYGSSRNLPTTAGGFDGGPTTHIQAYTEFDLLVAALKDHIRDLQVERDYLRAEVERLQQVAALPVPQMWRGMKPPH